MFFLDWLIIWIPILVVIYAALRTQKYVKALRTFSPPAGLRAATWFPSPAARPPWG